MNNAVDDLLMAASIADAADAQQIEHEGADTSMQEDDIGEDEDGDDEDPESPSYSEVSLLSNDDDRLPLDQLRGLRGSTDAVAHAERSVLADMSFVKDSTIARHPYPHLREISSLASWHVSSHKQGCGVPALRHPSTSQFWQSDGPQPHTLTIHFFKRVAVAHMRLHIDHELDESYTPTKMQVWAGSGMHDLVQVTEVALDNPKGWLVVDLSRAGGPSEFVEGEENFMVLEGLIEVARGDPTAMARELAKRTRRATVGKGPTLRCMVVQVRILENYQNGKDTHLRGCQIFAKDHGAISRNNAWLRERNSQRHLEEQHSQYDKHGGIEQDADVEESTLKHNLDAEARRAEGAMSDQIPKKHPRARTKNRDKRAVAGIREAEWMGEITLR